MAKINIGDRFPDFLFSTPFKENIHISETVSDHKTAIVFLRYYGCPVCQYDLAQYAKNYGKISVTSGKLFVVLQSDPKMLKDQLEDENFFPFEIICDPTGSLYRQLEILPAENKLKLIGPKTMRKIAKVQAAGYKHGNYEGEELQLPAVFILDSNLTVTYAHYGQTIDDVPDAKQIGDLLK